MKELKTLVDDLVSKLRTLRIDIANLQAEMREVVKLEKEAESDYQKRIAKLNQRRKEQSDKLNYRKRQIFTEIVQNGHELSMTLEALEKVQEVEVVSKFQNPKSV